MPYDKEILENAKKLGVFEDNVFDPKVLELSDEEKEKLQKKFIKYTINEEKEKIYKVEPKELKKKRIVLDVELSIFEKFIILLLSLLKISNEEEYKTHKVIKKIEKELSKIKPPLFNYNTRSVTKYFAYKVHDLYLKTVFLKKIIDNILESDLWDNINNAKTGIELLFEMISKINSNEVDEKFSPTGISRIISQFDNPRIAFENLEKALNSYLNLIDKSVINNTNMIFTNIIYFKNLFDFDFISFFKRFDSMYKPGVQPNFIDIPGNPIVSYLEKLEEALLQVELNIDNLTIFKELMNVSKKFDNYSDKIEEPDKKIDENLEERLQKEVVLLFEIIREFINKRILTLLIQVIRKDPLYSPNFIHQNYDLYKLYCETIQKRVKYFAKKQIKERTYQKIEKLIMKNFSNFRWGGIYDNNLSNKLEQASLSPFLYHYHIGFLISFMKNYYDDIIKNTLNILLLGGNFAEKHFYKTVSETFYNMERFDAKVIDFLQEYAPDGVIGKKFISLVSKYDGKNSELRKIIERNIVTMNGKAKDLFDEFYLNYITINDIFIKLYNDIESKPPKYIRNIKGIGGLKNSKFLNSIEKIYNLFQQLKEIITLLKE